jgi:hypothetical protein
MVDTRIIHGICIEITGIFGWQNYHPGCRFSVIVKEFYQNRFNRPAGAGKKIKESLIYN